MHVFPNTILASLLQLVFFKVNTSVLLSVINVFGIVVASISKLVKELDVDVDVGRYSIAF